MCSAKCRAMSSPKASHFCCVSVSDAGRQEKHPTQAAQTGTPESGTLQACESLSERCRSYYGKHILQKKTWQGQSSKPNISLLSSFKMKADTPPLSWLLESEQSQKLCPIFMATRLASCFQTAQLACDSPMRIRARGRVKGIPLLVCLLLLHEGLYATRACHCLPCNQLPGQYSG